MASAEPTTQIIMPRLSDSMEEGAIVQWLKAVGDEVAVGDDLVEIETDKANMVHESDAAGTLLEILVAEGEARAVGEPIARLGLRGGSAPPSDGANPGDRLPSANDPPAGTRKAALAKRRVMASPLARRIAHQHGLDLDGLIGTGRDGRIIKADVEAALASASASIVGQEPQTPPPRGPESTPSPAQAGSSLNTGETPTVLDVAAAPSGSAPGKPETAKGESELVALTRLQQTVARRMAESKATAPHFYLEAEIDISRCVGARARIKDSAAEGEIVPSFNDMVVRACALALHEFPRANGSYRDGQFELHSRVNIGVAVAAKDSLVVPTIFDADRKGLRQIAQEGKTLAQRVRNGSITPPELSGGTFTVSNLGMHGITSFAAVINPPQAGILAVGKAEEKPVVVDGQVTTAHRMRVNLACDHRILYGAEAAEFLVRLGALLNEPLELAG